MSQCARANSYVFLLLHKNPKKSNLLLFCLTYTHDTHTRIRFYVTQTNTTTQPPVFSRRPNASLLFDDTKTYFLKLTECGGHLKYHHSLTVHNPHPKTQIPAL